MSTCVEIVQGFKIYAFVGKERLFFSRTTSMNSQVWSASGVQNTKKHPSNLFLVLSVKIKPALQNNKPTRFHNHYWAIPNPLSSTNAHHSFIIPDYDIWDTQIQFIPAHLWTTSCHCSPYMVIVIARFIPCYE